MQVVAATGREDLARVYIARNAAGNHIEFVESLQPPLPREKKWVLIVSCLYGCPFACRICDAGGDYRGRLSREEIEFQVDYLVDRRFPDRKSVPQDASAVARALTPDYALGGHTASLGLCWLPAGTLPGFPDGMVIGQHGSWNRSTLSGYKVIFVPFENGRPSGPPRDILSGFLAPDEKVSYGRPVGVTLTREGALLVADDVGNVVWRVTAG